MHCFSTRAVHAGRADFNTLGVHAPPLDFSSTYPFTQLDEATASLDALVEGAAEAPNPIYARLHNPTVARFETALADLECSEAAIAFSSGMAALTATLLAVKQTGNHVVGVRPLYGTTDHLLSSGLLGLDVTWTTADAVADALRPDTALVMIETPANPTLQLVDIKAVVAQVGTVPVLVDSTFATPVLQQPLAHGATFVLHSATKFLGGHGDVMAGVVATFEAWAQRLRQVRVATGALLHPMAAYMLHRGLPTLALRVKRAQATAQRLADRLRAHDAIQAVHYPDDRTHPARHQMRGPGSILAFEVRGGYDAARTVLRAVQLMTPAVSLGSTDTLIQHPAGLTHRVVNADARAANGISDGLLRLSVGLEAAEDLWADLDHALAAARVSKPEASLELMFA
ncbi:MAG: PLP-dependent transferase [Rhodothermales bacterium]